MDVVVVVVVVVVDGNSVGTASVSGSASKEEGCCSDSLSLLSSFGDDVDRLGSSVVDMIAFVMNKNLNREDHERKRK